MKKQFFRVKQLADQTFLKADKSEGLNQDELRKADNKVEFIQKVLTEISKKLPNSVNESQEKRMKKYDEYNIKASIDSAMSENECSKNALLYYVLRESASTERLLAQEKLEYEKQVEEHVTSPINQIMEKELPTISKNRKILNKHILDKDAATSRYQSAKKIGTPKENNLKEEADEADIKLDQSRDALATEMFGLLRRENEICTFFLQLLKMQRSYHESACKLLQEIIPKLEQTVGENKIKPIFGCSLEEHLKTYNRRIAFPLEICVLSLMELGMSEEGLFRVTGSASRVKRLKYSIDSGCFTLPLIPEYRDVHVLAGTLKTYLRELPEPLLTYKLFDEWMLSMEFPDGERITRVKYMLGQLPQYNYDNLAFLMQFLSKLSKHPENRMTSSNIAIVFGPNLLWTQEKEIDMGMKFYSILNMLVEMFLAHLDVFFPTDMMKFAEIRVGDLIDAEEFSRPDINCLRQSIAFDNDCNADLASPKPSSRKKSRHAPAPPCARTEADNGSFHDNNYYLSNIGTASLNRPHKMRTDNSSRFIEREGSPKASSRRSSLVLDGETPNNEILVNKIEKVEEPSKCVRTQIIEQAKVEDVNAQVKPVAAPRTSILEVDKLQTKNAMSKSYDFEGDVTLRMRNCVDIEPKRTKPAVPTRPASLKAPLVKTQEEFIAVKIGNPPKQGTNLFGGALNKNMAAGHDNQIAEKEKFLGHQPMIKENKEGDINSNCRPGLPGKPPLMKSMEKLNVDSNEKLNGNESTRHVRTRSDGNIVEVGHSPETSLLQTPSSPRNLNKPSQPPPPPPNIVKAKPEPEMTNL